MTEEKLFIKWAAKKMASICHFYPLLSGRGKIGFEKEIESYLSDKLQDQQQKKRQQRKMITEVQHDR